MRVAVLGCGPAGLMACHAAVQLGAEVDILSHKVSSPMGGAQYLHDAIPGITEGHPDGVISYVKIGNSGGYADKVYGSPLAPTSWQAFPEGEHPCWSLHAAYMRLQANYWERVQEFIVQGVDIEVLTEQYDFIFSTVPADRLCLRPAHHQFNYQSVALIPSPMTFVPNLVMYNGRPSDAWYRTSNIFGHGWTEYAIHGGQKHPEHPDRVYGKKPLDTNCNCHQDHQNFVRLGRFGEWKKAVLTSDAYRTARLVVDEGAWEGVRVH